MKFLVFTLTLLFCFSVQADNPKKGDWLIDKPTHIFDGDTIAIGDERIRLEGIDCPEGKQLCEDVNGLRYRCGEEATTYLKDTILDNEVRCQNLGKDKYKRILGECYVDDLNINAHMVKSGYCISIGYNDVNLYKSEEDIAKKNNSGLWQGEFKIPYHWRLKYGKTYNFKF